MIDAINCYKIALNQKIADHPLTLAIHSNLAQCYLNLEMYEDALYSANAALHYDRDHSKTLFRKAKALAFLFYFREAIYILNKLGMKGEIKNV